MANERADWDVPKARSRTPVFVGLPTGCRGCSANSIGGGQLPFLGAGVSRDPPLEYPTAIWNIAEGLKATLQSTAAFCYNCCKTLHST